MKKAGYDTASRRYSFIAVLGITVLVFLLLVSIACATRDSDALYNKGYASDLGVSCGTIINQHSVSLFEATIVSFFIIYFATIFGTTSIVYRVEIFTAMPIMLKLHDTILSIGTFCVSSLMSLFVAILAGVFVIKGLPAK